MLLFNVVYSMLSAYMMNCLINSVHNECNMDNETEQGNMV